MDEKILVNSMKFISTLQHEIEDEKNKQNLDAQNQYKKLFSSPLLIKYFKTSEFIYCFDEPCRALFINT